MRKILFLALSLALLGSCSEESQTFSTTEKNVNLKSNSRLEDLYLDMINSSDYISLKEGVEIFISKMNTTDSSVYTDETTMFNWIYININSTDFNSYLDAQNEWSNIKNKQNTVRTLNSEFFTELEGTVREDFADVILASETLSPYPCLGSCYNQYILCRSNAANNLSDDMIETEENGGDIVNMILNLSNNLIARGECRSVYEACCGL